MAKRGQRISITWSDELQKYAEKVVQKYAGEMGIAGIPTRTTSTPDGEETFNRSGAIAFALMRMAEEIKPEEIVRPE
jgi:hypothetical protein